MIRAIRCVPFLLLLAVFDAFAGTYSPFWNPYVEPTNPTDHDSVRWVAEWDGCGVLGPPSVSRLGERLTVRWPIQGTVESLSEAMRCSISAGYPRAAIPCTSSRATRLGHFRTLATCSRHRPMFRLRSQRRRPFRCSAT